MVNSVCLIGRLTRDAELKYTNNGTALVNLSIAYNSKWTRNGETKEKVSFFDATLWGTIAEALATYLLKGTQIGLQGELEQQRWRTDSGESRSKINIIVEKIQLLGGITGDNKKYQDDSVSPMTENDKKDVPF